MKRTWKAHLGKSGIFSLTSAWTLGVMLGVTGCDQPQTVAQKAPSQTASGGSGTQTAGGGNSDAKSQPAKIAPEFVAPDGTVDLQGKSKPPKLHLPDVIDDDKHEIPADAVFGTPTLADPQPSQTSNEGAQASPEPTPVNDEKATTSPATPDDRSGKATEEPVVAPAEEPTPEPQGFSDAIKPATVPAQTVATTESQAPKKASGIGNLASEEELHQKIAEDWKNPQVVFVLTGQQHGYLEPCGCTGLERQKGGLIRRDTLVNQLRERGWQVVPLDVGNQVRKSFGLQPQLQFETTVRAFERMGYKAVSFGPEDLQLPSLSLIQTVGTENPKQPREFISANTAVLDRSFWPQWKVVPVGDRKIGITAYVNDPNGALKSNRDVMFEDAEKSVKAALAKLRDEGCDYMILLAHASQEDSEKMAVAVPGFDLVVTAGGHGEPRNVLDPIEGSKALISQVGTKGMYACLVGLFDDAKQPVRYQRVALSSQFKDSQPMFEIFKEYQKRLQNVVTREGFEGLGLLPQPHPSGSHFVGSDECSGCHSTAFEVWKKSPHFHATDSIVTPPNDRGGIPRHFDPECVVCHVTGWNVKSIAPYETGYVSLEKSPNLLGSGCENCHGPGSEHVKVENGDIEVDDDVRTKLREQMRLTLADAKMKCVECHDLDNSPDFHAGDGQFQDYWERPRPGFGPVKHSGKD